MGGIGSGRRSAGAADTVDDCCAMDVRFLAREGLLTPGRSSNLRWMRDGDAVASVRVSAEADRVVLSYRWRRFGAAWQAADYPVALGWTRCNFGARRPWFICPIDGCGRRIALLYIGNAGIFTCRRCGALTYPCQREETGERAARQADKIRDRLGWPPGILNGPGGKPKGMHWRTFERLAARHDALVDVCTGKMRARLDGL